MSPVLGRVLVGYDGSEPAREALDLARRLAGPDRAELLLARIDAHRAFRHHAKSAPVAAGDLPAELRARMIEHTAASAPRGLCELAERERADLLVIGSHPGPTGEVTLGTTAMRLLQGAPCAVAMAPLGLRERERLHHVGVAYDGSEEARAALTLGYALAQRDGTAVSIYQALPPFGAAYGVMGPELDVVARRVRDEVRAELDVAADLAPAGVNPRTVLVHDQAAAIARECDGIVDLLVLGSRGGGPLHRVFAGSVSRALIAGAHQPVLIVPRASVLAGDGG